VHCPSCEAALAVPSRFCPECGAAIARDRDASTLTVAKPLTERPSSWSTASAGGSDEGRFATGTILAGRYRIAGLAGRGGMGEVYRATDLRLNQTVALKFLPESTAGNFQRLERFHSEVRIARQVSHPNVCRVYDIGEAEGSIYLSMEYVDGEDLASLLRRIGRLPVGKATEIARKLCAGLAAAHAKGVLHRDLKPANIMIDGRGQVLIMDFGLAVIAEQVQGAEVRSGTPAYMAPEQLAGLEVTERSDIYSLGLVLYEIFTGQKAFKTAERSSLPSAAHAVKDMDPAMERVIARCLEPDAAKRPQSVLALARMLPGGDPMAEALAAGDTPSPEMVAASEDTGALSVRMVVVSMALVVVGLIATLLLTGKSGILRLTPFPNSYEILAQKARDIATRLGYTDPPADRAYSFNYDTEYHDWAEKTLKPDQYRAQIERGRPAPIYFAYRQSPQYLIPRTPLGNIAQDEDDPPQNLSGMVGMRLDPQGRLIQFRAVPPQLDSGNPPTRGMDWSKLFEASGLEPSRWTTAEPREIPLFAFDERAAWTGVYSDAPSTPLRIEAAAWKGRPVFFEISGPWWRPRRMQPEVLPTAAQRIVALVLVALICCGLLGALWLARRNFRQDRGDRRGSLRLAVVALVCYSLAFFLQMHHVPLLLEFNNIANAIAIGLFAAVVVWVLYMALEPYLRRRLSQSLISWTRLLAGDARDPLVAGHILAGTALGAGGGVLFRVADWLNWRRSAVLTMDPFTIKTLDVVGLARGLLGSPITVTAYVMFVVLMFLLFRVVLRNNWLTGGAFIALLAFLAAAGSPTPAQSAIFAVLYSLTFIYVMIRFGVLPCILMTAVAPATAHWPLTSDFSAWYAGIGLIVVALVLALAVWSFRNALGGRKVWQDVLL
jgi:serine/threonine-protein kinase